MPLRSFEFLNRFFGGMNQSGAMSMQIEDLDFVELLGLKLFVVGVDQFVAT